MTITPYGLTRSAAIAAIGAGCLYILVQFIHPVENVAAVTTAAWAITHYLTIAMAILALIGIAGIYLSQVERAGILGLVGFVLFQGCFLLITAFTFVEAFILPPLAPLAAGFVQDVLAVPTGGVVVGDIGVLAGAGIVSAITYVVGGTVFGLAMYRARVLNPWAAILLTAGAAATLVVPLLPHALGRLAAIPVGLALVALGSSLWRSMGTHSAPTVQPVTSAAL